MTLHKHGVKKAKSGKTIIDKLVLLVAIAEPLSSIPQVYTIYVKNQIAGVSVLSWSLYAAAACVWIAYGIYHKDKPIIITSTMWLIFEILIIVGVLLQS